MKNHLVWLALGLAVSACGQASEKDGSNSADQTAVQIEPGPVQAVSPDGVAAAQVLFIHEKLRLNPGGYPSEAAAKDWFDTTTGAVEAWVEKRDETSSTYWFTGKAGETTHQLVIDMSFPFTAFAPSYTSRIDETPAPATAKHLEGVDLSAVLALDAIGRIAKSTPADPAAIEFSKFAGASVVITTIDVQFLAPGNTQYKFAGAILGAAETIAGDGALDLNETGGAYRATSTLTQHL